MGISGNGRPVTPPQQKDRRCPQCATIGENNLLRAIPHKAGVKQGSETEDFEEDAQTLVWGKQSVWLSACRPPTPEGENRAEAQTHFNHVTKARNTMTPNRKRSLTLSIRVTPGEKDAILKKAGQAQMTLTDYLVTSALTSQIFVAEDLKPALG